MGMASEKEDNTTLADAGDSLAPLIAVAKFPLLWDEVCEDDFDVREYSNLKEEPLTNQDIEKIPGVSPAIAAELVNVCSPDTLKLDITSKQKLDSHYTITAGKVPKEGEQLYSVRLRAAQFQKLGNNYQATQSRSFHYDFEKVEPASAPSSAVTLLTVSVSITNKLPPGKKPSVRHDRELIVHAEQSLTTLRDKMVCPFDLVFLCGECSEFPETADDARAQDQYKSSFFFIENVFYSDMRDPAAVDISKPMRDWLNQGKSSLITGPVHFAKMEEKTFRDLSVRLGYPYVYVHQGDCEHIITFTDIRFMHNNDCQDLEQYPILSNQSMFNKVHCNSCKLMTAKWMTREDSLAPTDPCFFCDVCYYKFHYDARGNKLGSFSAYRHVDPSIFR